MVGQEYLQIRPCNDMWRFDNVSDKKSTARDLVVAFDLVFAFASNLRYLAFTLVFASLVKDIFPSFLITAVDIVNMGCVIDKVIDVIAGGTTHAPARN